ncbi:MAG: hypothetical protein IJW16_04510 [Clostridia bacterium]|nr:hypothetical protein [Clostridia bacterium]
MKELPRATDAKAYFEDIVNKMRNVKVKSVWSLSPIIGVRGFYMEDGFLYVSFENEQCLIIDYLFVDNLTVDLRSINEEERRRLDSLELRDYFNSSIKIYKGDKSEEFTVRKVEMEYAELDSIEIHRVTEEYSKWVDGDLEYVEPTDETFDSLKFVMRNGNSFTVCADDAMVDGYVNVWSDEAKITVT